MHRVHIRSPFHILILIISLVVPLAYLSKIRYAYFTGGHICQPYRVEIVEQDRQKNDISHKYQRNLNHFRVSALLCHGLCLLPNTVTTTADYYYYYYYYYFALKKLSYIYAKKLKTYVHFCWLRIHRNYKMFFNLAMCKRRKLNRKSRIVFGIKNIFRCFTSELYWIAKESSRPGQLRKGSYYWRKSMQSYWTNSAPVLCTVVRVLALQSRNLTSLPNSLIWLTRVLRCLVGQNTAFLPYQYIHQILEQKQLQCSLVHISLIWKCNEISNLPKRFVPGTCFTNQERLV